MITAAATNNATASINFSGYVKTLTISFGNGSSAGPNPSAQGFTIGTMTWSTVLPVTLLSFTAKPEGDRVQLAWATTSERDADRFIVERSFDLSEFMTVGEIPAKGTTDVRQQYGLTDMQPSPGINYYRLKQIDFDGTSHTFKPVSAIIRAEEPVVAVYPNPASSDRIHLRLWNADDVIIRLLTTSGQTISGRLEKKNGEADFVLEHSLPSGMYWLETRTKEQKRTTKVLIP